MEFNRLGHNNTKKVLLVLVVLVAITTTIVSLSSRAKYQVTSSVQIVKGKVSYQPYDFKIVKIYQENDTGSYDEVDEVPTTEYEINEEDSKCMIDDNTKDTEAILKTINGNHTFANLKKMDKCTVYFSKIPTPEDTLAQLNKASEKGTTDGFTNMDTTEHKNNEKTIMYSDEDDLGTTYYFRGKVKDNWVKFGKEGNDDIWWRIIRINGNGSIRMIYAGKGTSAPTSDGYLNNNRTGSQLQISGYNTYSNDNKYVGYMYGTDKTGSATKETTPTTSYDQAHTNNFDSDIKKILDNWYNTNLKTEYGKYIDSNAGFCNDRKIATISINDYGTEGYGSYSTVYIAEDRLINTNWNANTKHTPTFKCSERFNIFSLPGAQKPNGEDYGNHKLRANNGTGENSPIGLITIDEAVFAGGYYSRLDNQSDNTQFYLYTGQTYWTMTPAYFSIYGYATIFIIHKNGYLVDNGVSSGNGVRPVINLSANVKLSGEGTYTNPYTISD